MVTGGQPCATGTGDASEDIPILGVGPGTNSKAEHGVRGVTLYIGDIGAARNAQSLHGKAKPRPLERQVRGNGMISSWPCGRGLVFTAAACEWETGPKRDGIQAERVTGNELTRSGE